LLKARSRAPGSSLNVMASEDRGRKLEAVRLGAGVRSAHQLISGSSMTACHDPACMVEHERGVRRTLFAGTVIVPIVATRTHHPAPPAPVGSLEDEYGSRMVTPPQP
jgi:hypothetical protein